MARYYCSVIPSTWCMLYLVRTIAQWNCRATTLERRQSALLTVLVSRRRIFHRVRLQTSWSCWHQIHRVSSGADHEVASSLSDSHQWRRRDRKVKEIIVAEVIVSVDWIIATSYSMLTNNKTPAMSCHWSLRPWSRQPISIQMWIKHEVTSRGFT